MNENDKDVRRKQRFNNLKKAFSQLNKFIEKADLSELEIQGLLKAFEHTQDKTFN